jgi:hypothetical protein
VVVTRQTRLEELVSRLHTRDQARFYVEHLGADFADYELEHERYLGAKRVLAEALRGTYRHQFVDRRFVPNFVFAPDEVVVALGQDGLVANTMKYLAGQPLIGVNPEPARYDGVLLPFGAADFPVVLPEVLADRRPVREITMARVRLPDGQELHAVNDLFVGPRSHTSLRYELAWGGRREVQSSSGLIVSTGLGSTGWLRSVVTGASGIARELAGARGGEVARSIGWDERRLVFVVREPFPSRTTQATLVAGEIATGGHLLVRSMTPDTGVIFSDGMEADYLQFPAGTLADIAIAERRGRLVQ